MIGQCNLVVKCCWFQFPLKTTVGAAIGATTLHLVCANSFKDFAKTLDVNILNEVGNHCDCCNLYPRRSYIFG